MEIKIFRIRYSNAIQYVPLTANTNIGLFDNGVYSMSCNDTDIHKHGTLGDEISANEFESFVRCFEKAFNVIH